MTRLMTFFALLAILTAVTSCDWPTPVRAPLDVSLEASPPAPPASTPSVLVLLLDDAQLDMVDRQTMPKTFAWIADSGLTFAHGIANTPLCCPSRGGMQTGYDQHRTGIKNNSWATGLKNFNDHQTLWTALAASYPGMARGMFGKWLNDNALKTPWPYRIPGLNYASISKLQVKTTWGKMAYVNFTDTEWQPGIAPHDVLYTGSSSAMYQPNVLAGKLTASIAALSAGTPFVFWLTALSPHMPATPDPRDVGSCAGRPKWRWPNYNQAGTKQPAMIRLAQQPFPFAQSDTIQTNMCETLVSADRMIDSVMSTLQHTGRLASTYVILTSDNGYCMGQNNLFQRKAAPYHCATDVTFMIRGPGVAHRVDNTHFAQLIDVTPTILDLMGIPNALPNMAGKSLRPLFSGALVGGYDEALLEGLVPDYPKQHYSGIRTMTDMYVEFGNGEKALYDYSNDPFEMNNVASLPAYAALRATRASRLAQLKTR